MNPLTRVATLAVMAALLVSCGEDDDDPTAPDVVDPVANDLVFTRADQTEIPFSSVSWQRVWCGPWEEGEVDMPTLRIWYFGQRFEDPGWILHAVVADVVLGEPIPFPTPPFLGQPQDAAIFVYDPPNDVSTHDNESIGAITFQKLDCEIGGQVQFSIDAVIGNESSDSSPVHVTGTFRAIVGEGPPW